MHPTLMHEIARYRAGGHALAEVERRMPSPTRGSAWPSRDPAAPVPPAVGVDRGRGARTYRLQSLVQGSSDWPTLRRRAGGPPSRRRPNVVRGRRVRRPASRRGWQRRGRRRHALRPRRAARQRRRPRRLPEPHAVRPRIRAGRRRMAHSAIESGSSAAVSSALPIAASRRAFLFRALDQRERLEVCLLVRLGELLDARPESLRLCGDPAPLFPVPASVLAAGRDQARGHRGHDARDGTRPGSGCTARRSRRARRAGRGRTDPSSGSLRRIELGEAGTQRFGERRAWLIAGRGERSLEVRDETNAERRVRRAPARRSHRAGDVPREAPARPAPSRSGAGGSMPSSSPRRSSSCGGQRSCTSRRVRDRISSLEFLAQLAEAARDPARDRSGGQIERFADDAVALVAREEAVEHLAAVRRAARAAPRGRRAPRRDARSSPSTSSASGSSVGCSRVPARSRSTQAFRVSCASQGLIAVVVAQRVEPFERAGEDVLEDVLGVVLRQPESAHGDRVHVAREAFDELVPRLLLSRPAALDELRVGEFDGHRGTAHSSSDLSARGKKPARCVRPVVEARGFDGNGEEHQMTDRRKRWLRRLAIGVSHRCIRRAGRGQAHTLPADGWWRRAAARRQIQRPDDRSARFTVSDSRCVLASALGTAPQCGRTTAQTGSRSRTAPHAATSSNVRASPGTGP